MSRNHHTVYCDGSCLKNPGPAAWGAVLEHKDGSTQEFSGAIGHGTNQIAELTAAIEALKRLPEGEEIHLYSDSKYVVEGLKSWLAGWKRKGWKTSAGGPVANETLWRRLDELCAKRRVKPHWVKGHAGHPLNERADELARAAQPA